MNRKKLMVGLFTLFFVLLVMPISATSGRVKASSITSCGGTNYGEHGDGHWHAAEKNGGYWNAVGSPVGYSNPCGSQQQSSSRTSDYQQSALAAREAQAQNEKEAKERKEQEERERKEIEEAARVEKIRKENVKIKSLNYKETSILNLVDKSDEFLIKGLTSLDISGFSAVLENPGATVNLSFLTPLLPFEENLLNIEVIGEDPLKQEKHKVKIFPVGNIDDFNTQMVEISFATNESLKLNTTMTHIVSRDDLDKLGKEGTLSIKFKNKSDHDKSLKPYVLKNVNYKITDTNDNSELTFMIEDLEVKVELEKEDLTVKYIIGALAIGALSLAGYGVYKKKVKNKDSI